MNNALFIKKIKGETEQQMRQSIKQFYEMCIKDGQDIKQMIDANKFFIKILQETHETIPEKKTFNKMFIKSLKQENIELDKLLNKQT